MLLLSGPTEPVLADGGAAPTKIGGWAWGYAVAAVVTAPLPELFALGLRDGFLVGVGDGDGDAAMLLLLSSSLSL